MLLLAERPRHEAGGEIPQGHVQCRAALRQDALPATGGEDSQGTGTWVGTDGSEGSNSVVSVSAVFVLNDTLV